MLHVTHMRKENNLCNKERSLDIKLFSSFISSPEHEVLMVSYCGQSMSVVRRSSCVVCVSTIALKAYSSYIPGPIDPILDRKHRGDL